MAREMISRQNIDLDLVPGGVLPVLHVSQYDSAYDVHFTIYKDGQLFTIPEDVSIRLEETKLDGNGFTVGATKSPNYTGQCYIWMQEQMTAIPGDQICELVLTNTGGDRIGTANFILRVEPAALSDGTVISESRIAYAAQVVNQLGSVAAYKEQLDAQDDDIDQLNTNLAAETSTRAAADASLQSQINQLVAPEGEAPSAAEITNARVGADGTVYQTLGDAIRGQVTDVKSAIDDMTIETAPVYIENWAQGYIRPSNGTIGTSPYYCVTGWLTFADGVVNVYIKTGYAIDIAQYSSTAGTHGVFDEHIVREESRSVYSFTADAEKFYKIDIKKLDSSEVTPTDIPNDALAYTLQYFTDETLTIKGKAADAKATGEAIHKNYVGGNALDQTTLTLDAFIRNDNGTQGSSTDYAVTDYIPVTAGDTIVASYAAGAFMAMRYVTAYSEEKTLMRSSGADNVNSYTVPTGVAYIRISANKTRITSSYARVCRSYVTGQKVFYEPYYDGELSDFAIDNRTDIQTLKEYPLTKLPSYILDSLAYKPLGILSKGYICLVSDDGDADLATYTIPMVIAKDVPCTFAVMKVSSVFETQTGTDAVIDAVNNHGCVIAQHGITTWDQHDELTLNGFFEDEKAYWDSLGLTAYGAVCPAHEINNLIRVVAGGRFGCVRTGYDDGLPRYANYTNGPRSNMYGLTSQSSLDGSLETQKAILDTVKENHWLRMLHWHENELTTEKKAQLEGIIDYGKQIGLTFVTMKDIPWLI